MAKVMISIPDDLLEQIDSETERRDTTRSGFLRNAARKELGRASPEEIDAAFERAQATFADAGPFESADVIREQRDAMSERDRRRL